MRVLLTLCWFFVISAVCIAQTTFYFPQVANGVQGGGLSWKTTIFITNPAAAGSNTASGTITFTTSSGTAFNLSFVDSDGAAVGSGNTIPFQIAGGQTRQFVSSGGGDLASGFATVSSNQPVSGTAVFSLFSGSTLIGEAGVPASSPTARQTIFVDEKAGFQTAVAYANPNAAGASLTLQLLNTQGTAVVQSTTRTLGISNHTAAYVNQLFANTAGITGTMQITSDRPLAAIALRFSPQNLFTTLPPVTLASLINPALQWLGKALPAPLGMVARLLGNLRIG